MKDYEHQFIKVYCANCGDLVRVMMSCGDRLCEACAKRRMGVLINKYKRNFQSVRAEDLKWGDLTMVNCDDLEAGYKRLKECSKKFFADPRIAPHIRSKIITYQATNKGRGWHVHLHYLADMDYIPQEIMSKIWLEITGDSFIVSIAHVRDAESTFAYLVGYACKAQDVLPSASEEYNRVFKGRRLLEVSGKWRGDWTIERDPFECTKCGGVLWVSEFQLDGLCFHGAHLCCSP